MSLLTIAFEYQYDVVSQNEDEFRVKKWAKVFASYIP